jgi:hypothetical protein
VLTCCPNSKEHAMNQHIRWTLRLQTWLSSAGYFDPSNAPVLHARLVAVPRGTTGSQADARAGITLALVAALQGLHAQIAALGEHIAAQLEAHPDSAIFTSPPRSGTLRASPATPTPPTPGPPTSTDEHANAVTTTRTPSASSPAPGCTSSEAAGKTASPNDPVNHRALQRVLAAAA